MMKVLPGGRDGGEGSEGYSDILEYSLDTGGWVEAGAMARPRCGNRYYQIISTKIYKYLLKFTKIY